jgi:hypothetical protein
LEEWIEKDTIEFANEVFEYVVHTNARDALSENKKNITPAAMAD